MVSDIDPELLKERLRAIEERRFSSTYLQVKSVTDIGDNVASILEVGPGSGYFASITKLLEYDVTTTDIKSRNNPDYLGDFRELKISTTFDMVVAFEVLQHIPYSEFRSSLTKLRDLSNRYVLISLPASVHSFGLSINLPSLISPRRLGLAWLRGTHSMYVNWEWPRKKYYPESEWSDRSDYWNPHYWEVGRKEYPRSNVLKEIRQCGLKILWHKYNQNYTHHLFILAEKTPRSI